MTTMTHELRQAIEEAGDNPPKIIDAETNTTYVLLREDVYERIRSLVDSDEGMTPREMVPLMWDVMKGDWDEPEMDDYDKDPEE
jgi:hypothetical protein